jgi:hypothetical protein
VLPFDQMEKAYTMFDKHEDGAVKMVLKTEGASQGPMGKVRLSEGPAVLQPQPGFNLGNGRPLPVGGSTGTGTAMGTAGGGMTAGGRGGVGSSASGTGTSAGVSSVPLGGRGGAVSSASGTGVGLSSGLAGTTSTARPL